MSSRIETFTNTDLAQESIKRNKNKKHIELSRYGHYNLDNPKLLPVPDLAEDQIAYNPSPMHTVETESGTHDILLARVEPRLNHLGNTVIRAYSLNSDEPDDPFLEHYRDFPDIVGEDPHLIRISMQLGNKAVKVWLLSCVGVVTKPDDSNSVDYIRTKFYIGEKLDKLEQFAEGPKGEKDIRMEQDSSEIIHLYGRPQTEENSGNITYTTIPSIRKLNEQAILSARYIDDGLLPIGSGVWGGVNDIMLKNRKNNMLLGHYAYRTGDNKNNRHYEARIWWHDRANNTIIDLGTIATANAFSIQKEEAKAEDLYDVVFPGGFHRQNPNTAVFGVSDSRIGIADIVGRKQRNYYYPNIHR